MLVNRAYYLTGRVYSICALKGVITDNQDYRASEKQDKQKECTVSIYEYPKITHILKLRLRSEIMLLIVYSKRQVINLNLISFYCIKNLNLPIFFSEIPVPLTTARKGSSAICTGSFVLA